VPFLTMVGVRAQPGSAAADRLEAWLGAALPTTCGAVAAGEGVSVLGVSPDEFRVVSDHQRGDLTTALAGALDGEPGSATDLSANRTTFELSGPVAREVLEKGCPLDLHPRAFEIGSAYVTVIASIPVVLWKTADEVFRILPRSSFADFLGRWLIDAMAEFKATELP
jgi:sarcosine oxidase subunit gamma